MMNFQKMMQQAQEMQFKLQEMQEKLKDIEIQGQSGGGMVTVTMACSGVLRSLNVDPSLIMPEDKETMEDLIIAAVNNAIETKDARVEAETQGMMKAMGMPEGTKMPF